MWRNGRRNGLKIRWAVTGPCRFESGHRHPEKPFYEGKSCPGRKYDVPQDRSSPLVNCVRDFHPASARVSVLPALASLLRLITLKQPPVFAAAICCVQPFRFARARTVPSGTFILRAIPLGQMPAAYPASSCCHVPFGKCRDIYIMCSRKRHYSCNPQSKTPPHTTGLRSAEAQATRSPISRCADRILSAEARRKPRTSLSFDSIQISHLVGSNCHGFTPLR